MNAMIIWEFEIIIMSPENFVGVLIFLWEFWVGDEFEFDILDTEIIEKSSQPSTKVLYLYAKSMFWSHCYLSVYLARKYSSLEEG